MTSNPSSDTQAQNELLQALGPRDPQSFPFASLPEPTSADAKCKVALIRTGRGTFPKFLFVDGPVPRGPTFVGPSFSFLIEKEKNGQVERVLFELGMRESNKYMNPFYKMVTASWNLDLVAPDGVADTLKANGISLESISAAILGHVHCDHTGNLATFPKSVGLVVGPGSPASGENLATEIDVAPEVLEGRSFRELSREKDAWKDIGTFKGLDYFGDGSMWLLDTPGHQLGHLAALVRVSTNPSIYYILASDSAHHPCILSQIIHSKIALFPETVFNPQGDPSKLISTHHDVAEAYETTAKMRRLDLEPNVLAFIAHDRSMDIFLPEGDIVKLEGTMEELEKIKARDQTREE